MTPQGCNGPNIRIDERWIGGEDERRSHYAAELMRSSSDVIFACFAGQLANCMVMGLQGRHLRKVASKQLLHEQKRALICINLAWIIGPSGNIAPFGLSLAASFSKPDVHIGSLVARSKP